MGVSWFTILAFGAGMALMGWIKGFQVTALREALDRAIMERDLARKNQERVVEAAHGVVEAERVVDKAGDLPRPAGLGLLLRDATVDPSSAAGQARPARPDDQA